MVFYIGNHKGQGRWGGKKGGGGKEGENIKQCLRTALTPHFTDSLFILGSAHCTI